MHHKATLKIRENFIRPYHVECSCGTAGDFATELEAKTWMEHVHFRRLSGISTSEFAPTDIPASAAETVGDA
jgi:hypothetical protein